MDSRDWSSAVCSSDLVSTTVYFCTVADTVVVVVIVYDCTIDAGFANAIDVDTEGVVGVGSWIAVVVTGVGVSATVYFCTVADTVVVVVVVYDCPIEAASGSAREEDTVGIVGVGSRIAVVVTGVGVSETV